MLYRLFLLVGSLFFLTAADAQITTLRLNEVLASNAATTNSDGTVTDLVEIYNSGDIALDMEGCSLSDSNAYPRRYVFPAGSIIEAHAFQVMRFDSRYTNDPISSTKVPFGIKASGGFLHLYSPADEVIPIDTLEYGLQVQDFSIGRVTDGTGPFLLTIPTLGGPNVEVELGLPSVLSINEWMANNSGGPDYFEIYNPGNKPISIGGCFLTDNPASLTKFRIPDLSYIGTGVISGYLKFDADSATNKYPADHVNFSLSNNGENVGLYDTLFSVIDFVSFGRQTSGVSEGRLPDGQGGIAVQPGSPNRVFFPKINDYDTASPGAPNFLILTNLSINEILTHTDIPLEDAVEILNLGSTDQDISGWWLSNQRLNPKKHLIPNGTALTPGGFHVIYEGVGTNDGFNGSGAAQPFTFNSAHGDQVVLSQVDANGDLTGYIVYEEFEAAANGISFGHYNTSVPGDYKFVAMSATTFGFDDPNTVLEFRQGPGQANAYPKIGPLVINEIMFAPSNTVYGTNLFPVQNPEEEYIELRNVTSDTVRLYDPLYSTNRWKLQRAISFVFPELTELAPNSFCLVVGFDPATNAAALANFRTLYNVSDDVPIFGPWIGQLNDGGDAIELYSPDPPQGPQHPDFGFVPYIRIDKVNYRTSPPWPGGANSTGFSLQRKNSLLFGNDPFNWAADAPNAGRASIALEDTDGDGMPDTWEMANEFDPENSSDAALDADNDSVSNLGEYLSGTDPHDVGSVLKIAEIVPYQGTNVAVRFLAYSNATYSVQYRGSLTNAPNWQRVDDVPPAPVTRMVEVPDLNAWKKADRYYRIIAPAVN